MSTIEKIAAKLAGETGTVYGSLVDYGHCQAWAGALVDSARVRRLVKPEEAGDLMTALLDSVDCGGCPCGPCCESCGDRVAAPKFALCVNCAENEIGHIQGNYMCRGSLTFTEAQEQIARVCAQAGLNPEHYRP